MAVDVRDHVEFTRTHGVFFGVRDFQCGGGTGFVVRLTANFSYGPDALIGAIKHLARVTSALRALG